MLRRLHWAPICLLGISVSAWFSFTGCQASDEGGFGSQPAWVAGGSSSSSAASSSEDGNGGTTAKTTSKDATGGATAESSAKATGGKSSTAKGGSGGEDEPATTKATKGGTSSKTSSSKASTAKGGTSATKTTAKGEGGTTDETTEDTTPTTVAQTCTDDLMTLPIGAKNDWIASSSGKSCGVQGAIYGYGDDTSCEIPADGICTREEDGGPVKCCISGETVVDDTYKAWGCAIGLDLNAAAGGGDKAGYKGAAKGFEIGITVDTIAAGQEVRVAYEQSEADAISPFVGGKSQASTVKVSGGKATVKVLFTDVSCPPSDWGKCTAPGKAPLALQIQLSGTGTEKTKVGAFKDFCVTSIKPL